MGGAWQNLTIVVDWCRVFLCILHCCMAIGRLQVAFVEARLEALPKENAEPVQRVLYQARARVKLGAFAAPDGAEGPSSLRGRKWAHCWPMSRRSLNGKPLLPRGIYFGACTATRPFSRTRVCPLSRGGMAHIAVRPPSSSTTSSA